MSSGSVVHIVWSPRRIERALANHECLAAEMDMPTAFITGYTEHQGCAKANEIVAEHPADVYLLSYDDQVPTRAQVEEVLRLQAETGDVVSGWQLLGQDSPFGAAARPSYGIDQYLSIDRHCMYEVQELRDHPNELVESIYFAALTAVPRRAMLDCPMWARSTWIAGAHLAVWPNPDGSGEPFDKGCASDWTLSTDLVRAGYKVWVATKVEVEHLAPQHGIPAHRFWMDEDPQGVFWDRRPRTADELGVLAA